MTNEQKENFIKYLYISILSGGSVFENDGTNRTGPISLDKNGNQIPCVVIGSSNGDQCVFHGQDCYDFYQKMKV